MTDILKSTWLDLVAPLFRRPKRVQVAALCYREKKNRKEVLLITSRDTGRWILPKGWPIDGLDEAGAALQEAWEEAGVKKGEIANSPLGTFNYDKRMDSGALTPVEAQVFEVKVQDMRDEFPETDERTRRWVAPAKAAEMVDEPELKQILNAF
jgi:8-oxo-dGTP pyrophosphatase MutT (NUDIX family)